MRCEVYVSEITTCSEITIWALTAFDRHLYQTDDVTEFSDAPLQAMRSAAMDWLEQSSSRGHDDPGLCIRLIKTPFDDVRLGAVDCLYRNAQAALASIVVQNADLQAEIHWLLPELQWVPGS